MLEEMKEMLKELLADDEIFSLTAQMFKKSHDALVRAGFSAEQATTIVAGQGMGFKNS